MGVGIEGREAEQVMVRGGRWDFHRHFRGKLSLSSLLWSAAEDSSVVFRDIEEFMLGI